MKKTVAFLIIAALLCPAAIGCSKAGVVQTIVWKEKNDSVKLCLKRDKEGATVLQGYSHPRELTEDQMAKILAAVTYSEYRFFTWSKPKPVFVDMEIQKLKASLAQAFSRATADQWVAFTSNAKKRDLLLPTPRMSDGIMFFQGDKFNLVFNNLNLEKMDEQTPVIGDPRESHNLGPYRLNAGDAASVPPVDASNKYLTREHRNWIVIDTAALFAPPKVEPAQGPTAPQTVEDRLKELQRLYEQGLINKEEYEQKKKEILEKL